MNHGGKVYLPHLSEFSLGSCSSCDGMGRESGMTMLERLSSLPAKIKHFHADINHTVIFG